MTSFEQAIKNNDVVLYHFTDGCTVFLTETGGIGLNVGGYCIVKPIRDWHALAKDTALGTTADRGLAADVIALLRPDDGDPFNTGWSAAINEVLELLAAQLTRSADAADTRETGTSAGDEERELLAGLVESAAFNGTRTLKPARLRRIAELLREPINTRNPDKETTNG